MALIVLATAGICVSGLPGSAQAGFFSNATSRFFGPKSYALDVAPIVGAPANVSQQLLDALVSAGPSRKLTITPNGSGAAYTLRGYLLASSDKSGTKLSYIWDISDAKGGKVGRVSGEQVVPGRASDPWAKLDSATIQSLATKITGEIADTLSGSKGSTETATATPAPTPAPAPSAPAASAPAAAPASSGPVMALVSPVAGAPGDGTKSLTAALKQQLNAGGIKLATAGARNVYTVKGTVRMRDAGGGRQSVRIDWLILNPNGSKRGTVSQQNTVTKGMLDGPWGAIADAAAADAAKGIIKLLPPPT